MSSAHVIARASSGQPLRISQVRIAPEVQRTVIASDAPASLLS
jgi:hypothetical protein